MSLITRLAAAAGLAAVLAAPAVAQKTSTALNGQLNWGDVVANINVVTHDDAKSAAAIATAAGNAVSGANITGGLDADSRQQMNARPPLLPVSKAAISATPPPWPPPSRTRRRRRRSTARST